MGAAAPTKDDNFTPVTDAVAKTNPIGEVWKSNFPAEMLTKDYIPFGLDTAYAPTDVYHLVAERRLYYSSDADCKRMEP